MSYKVSLLGARFASHVVIFQQNWLSIYSTSKAVGFPYDTIRAYLLGPLAAYFLDNFPNNSTPSSSIGWPSMRLQLMTSCETLRKIIKVSLNWNHYYTYKLCQKGNEQHEQGHSLHFSAISSNVRGFYNIRIVQSNEFIMSVINLQMCTLQIECSSKLTSKTVQLPRGL